MNDTENMIVSVWTLGKSRRLRQQERGETEFFAKQNGSTPAFWNWVQFPAVLRRAVNGIPRESDSYF